MDCHEVCKAASNGHYEHEYFKTKDGGEFTFSKKSTIARLRAAVQHWNNKFSEDIRTKGHKYQISRVAPGELDPIAITEEGSGKSNSGPKKISKAEAYSWVKGVVLRSRGTELFGSFNPHVIAELFWEQSQPWGELANAHADLICDICENFLSNLFEKQGAKDVTPRIWLVPHYQVSLIVLLLIAEEKVIYHQEPTPAAQSGSPRGTEEAPWGPQGVSYQLQSLLHWQFPQKSPREAQIPPQSRQAWLFRAPCKYELQSRITLWKVWCRHGSWDGIYNLHQSQCRHGRVQLRRGNRMFVGHLQGKNFPDHRTRHRSYSNLISLQTGPTEGFCCECYHTGDRTPNSSRPRPCFLSPSCCGNEWCRGHVHCYRGLYSTKSAKISIGPYFQAWRGPRHFSSYSGNTYSPVGSLKDSIKRYRPLKG